MRLLILVILLYLLYRVVKRFLGFGQKPLKSDQVGAVDELVQDPQCKTYVSPRDAERRVIEGKEFLFCSEQCADEFEKEMKS
jgi:YHS domain-containing protein